MTAPPPPPPQQKKKKGKKGKRGAASPLHVPARSRAGCGATFLAVEVVRAPQGESRAREVEEVRCLLFRHQAWLA